MLIIFWKSWLRAPYSLF